MVWLVSYFYLSYQLLAKVALGSVLIDVEIHVQASTVLTVAISPKIRQGFILQP